MEKKNQHLKLFYNTIRRLGDFIGILLLIAAILFGLRL